MTNQNIEQVQIQGLINLANINSLKFKSLKNEINRLDSRITNFNEKTKTPYEQILEEEKEKRGCLSITYPPQGKNKYNTPDDYFSMEKVLWNNVFNETNSTIDMNNWILESTDKWEREIDKNIELLKQVTTTEQYKLLQKSQKEWEEYKTAQYKFLDEVFSNPGGNAWYTMHLLYRLKLIEDRAGILHSLYEDSCNLQKKD